MAKKALTLIFITCLIMPVWGYAGTDSCPVTGSTSSSFSEWLNAKPQDKQMDEKVEKIVLREQWERTLGFDVFYPYFKAKELESRVSEKASVRVFKLKGKPEVKENSVKYIFRIKF